MVVEKYLVCPETFFCMSGKFYRMFVDMSGNFLLCPENNFGEIPPPPNKIRPINARNHM